MRATIRLERFEFSGRYATYFGENKSKPWLACITGLDRQYGFIREFIRPVTDYSQACGIATRGVDLWYFVDDGIYEVNNRVSWKRVERYFIKVSGTTIQRISKEEVLCLLNPASVLTF